MSNVSLINGHIDKTTNAEIIKALEYCKDCSANLNVEIIDLINRQQAEIERLRNENEILSKNADTAFQGVVREALDIINHQQEKNDDLLYKLTGVMHSVDKWLDGDELKQDEVHKAAIMREKTLRLIETAKAEAIKEFAEKLDKNFVEIESKLPDNRVVRKTVQILKNMIKSLAKERVDEE